MTKPCLAPLDHITPLAFPIPERACDSHAHIFGPYSAYALSDDRSYTPPENALERYLAHLQRIGFARGVLVTASACGTDNRSVLDALAEQPDRLRGVAVTGDDVDRETLLRWRKAGITGLRFNLYAIDGRAVYRNGVGLDMLERLAPVMRDLGLHAQIWVHAPDLVQLAPRLLRLNITLVIDHMGRMNASRGVQDPGFQQLLRMLKDGDAWTKISGADRNTNRYGLYDDIDGFARQIVAANPEQVVWGSDWPHINYYEPVQVPDDGVLLNTLARWLPDEKSREQVLVVNPARLYQFESR